MLSHMPRKFAVEVDDDRVDARLLRVDELVRKRLAQPGAEGRAAGEIDDPDRRMPHEVLRDRRRGLVRGEQRDVGIEARLAQDFAQSPDRDRAGQDRRRMRLDDHRVAGGEAGEEAGIKVPGREGRAADLDRDAARHDAEALHQADGLALALRLLPPSLARRAAHLGDRIGHRLETAVLRVRAARLEGHAP